MKCGKNEKELIDMCFIYQGLWKSDKLNTHLE
jgi:hypothetical protein